MKKPLLALLIFFTILKSNAQIKIDSTGSVYTYSEVVSLSKLKNALFENAQVWAADKYPDYKEAVNYENKQIGKIVIKTAEDIPGGDAKFVYTLTIDCKDKKYRAVISDVKIHQHNSIVDEWHTWPFEFFIENFQKDKKRLLSITDPAEKTRIGRQVSQDEFIKSTTDMMANVVLMTLKAGMKASPSKF